MATPFTQRSDLALECVELTYGGREPDDDGIEIQSVTSQGLRCDRMTVRTKLGADKIGKPVGRYVTVEVGKISTLTRDAFANACDVLSAELSRLLPKGNSCLVAALGNRIITADSQGPLCSDSFLVTRHIKEHSPKVFSDLMLFETSCIAPGVLASTGIEAAGIVKGVVDKVKPDFVIAVDSLASRRLSRVGTTVQITDTGISPGSGVGNCRKALNLEALGVPVIAIGIPTVVDAVTVGADILEECLMKEDSKLPHTLREEILRSVLACDSYGHFVTPKDCDKISKQAGRLIAMGINKALNPSLSMSEIEELVG